MSSDPSLFPWNISNVPINIAIIRTMRDCLTRVSEAASFTWQQIECRPDGSATITFRRPKTDADTTAYLPPITVAALDAIRHVAGTERVSKVFGRVGYRPRRQCAPLTMPGASTV